MAQGHSSNVPRLVATIDRRASRSEAKSNCAGTFSLKLTSCSLLSASLITAPAALMPLRNSTSGFFFAGRAALTPATPPALLLYGVLAKYLMILNVFFNTLGPPLHSSGSIQQK